MSGSDVVMDTWAWWEILFETDEGRGLSERYVENPTVAVHTSALAIAEICAKLSTADRTPTDHGLDRGELETRIVSSIRATSELHDVTTQIARKAGTLRTELRDAKKSASLADAIMLVTARELGATLISQAGALEEQPDVQAR